MATRVFLRTQPARGAILTLDQQAEILRRFEPFARRQVIRPLRREIGRALGQTRPEHKLTFRGEPRTPLVGRVGARAGAEVSGSTVQRKAFVRVQADPKRTYGRDTDNPRELVNFVVVAGSEGKSKDDKIYTLDLLQRGRKGGVSIFPRKAKRLAFWGRRGAVGNPEGAVFKRKVTQGRVAPRQPLDRVVSDQIKRNLQDEFFRLLKDEVAKDWLRKTRYHFTVEVDL